MKIKRGNKSKALMSLFARRKVFLITHKIGFFFKISFIIFLCLFAFTGSFKNLKNKIWDQIYYSSSLLGLNYEKLRIEGQNNVPTEDIARAILSNKTSYEDNVSILSIDLNEVKNTLDRHEWIKDSVVERRLPDTIFVSILERIPIAVWQFNQKLYLIDKDGIRITNKDITKYPNMIRVIGEGANIYAQRLISDLSEHPSLASKVIMATRFGNRRWDIVFDTGLVVKMPENNFKSAYNYLYNLDKKDKLFAQDYKTIDLRIENLHSIVTEPS